MCTVYTSYRVYIPQGDFLTSVHSIPRYVFILFRYMRTLYCYGLMFESIYMGMEPCTIFPTSTFLFYVLRAQALPTFEAQVCVPIT